MGQFVLLASYRMTLHFLKVTIILSVGDYSTEES